MAAACTQLSSDSLLHKGDAVCHLPQREIGWLLHLPVAAAPGYNIVPAAHRREEVVRSDGRRELRWYLSDPHGTSWLAVAGLKGDQAGAAAPGQAFMAQGSFVTRTPFSSTTEAGVEAFLQQILRATGKPLPQQQTAGEDQLLPCITSLGPCPALPCLHNIIRM